VAAAKAPLNSPQPASILTSSQEWQVEGCLCLISVNIGLGGGQSIAQTEPGRNLGGGIGLNRPGVICLESVQLRDGYTLQIRPDYIPAVSISGLVVVLEW
jgi:hypothetical protein